MDLGFTIYSVIFLVTTLISFFVAYLAWHASIGKGSKRAHFTNDFRWDMDILDHF